HTHHLSSTIRHLKSPTLFPSFPLSACTTLPTPSLHAALPISSFRTGSLSAAYSTTSPPSQSRRKKTGSPALLTNRWVIGGMFGRAEEHTSELQSRENIVCRLMLEKKKKIKRNSKLR